MILSGSLALAALAFGFGPVLLDVGQLLAAQNRGGRMIGFVLVAGGAFTMDADWGWTLEAGRDQKHRTGGRGLSTADVRGMRARNHGAARARREDRTCWIMARRSRGLNLLTA